MVLAGGSSGDEQGIGEQSRGLPWWLSSKESACQCRKLGFDPGLGSSPGERNGSPLQYSCLGKRQEAQRSLVGYSPWGCKESDVT